MTTSDPQFAEFWEPGIRLFISEYNQVILTKPIDLDPLVLQDLRVLSKDNANAVAKHILMAAFLMEEDPKLALSHARAAKERAGRVSVVRETCGIAAYKAGE